jgi:hypothetical protein
MMGRHGEIERGRLRDIETRRSELRTQQIAVRPRRYVEK